LAQNIFPSRKYFWKCSVVFEALRLETWFGLIFSVRIGLLFVIDFLKKGAELKGTLVCSSAAFATFFNVRCSFLRFFGLSGIGVFCLF
jgi:hypothetical protein